MQRKTRDTARDSAHGLHRTGPYTWELPATGGMRVPGRIYADASLVDALSGDGSLDQVANVAHLPGILCCSLAMPDIHLGYGFPIGGRGGVRRGRGGGLARRRGLRHQLRRAPAAPPTCELADVRDKIKPLVDQLFRDVPSGVGSSGAIAKLSRTEMERLLVEGAGWAVKKGYGSRERPRPHGGRRRAARRRPRGGERAGLRARAGPGGHPGLGQPLPGVAGGGRGLRPGGGGRLSGCARGRSPS